MAHYSRRGYPVELLENYTRANGYRQIKALAQSQKGINLANMS
jgi:hypothetical protein